MVEWDNEGSHRSIVVAHFGFSEEEQERLGLQAPILERESNAPRIGPGYYGKVNGNRAPIWGGHHFYDLESREELYSD